MMGGPVLMTTDLDIIKEVFIKDFQQLLRQVQSACVPAWRWVLGKSGAAYRWEGGGMPLSYRHGGLVAKASAS